MIKFINLNNGSVFDGSTPYIHWFDKEQSTGVYYVKHICAIGNTQTINVKIKSSVFKLLDIDKITSSTSEYINEFEYKDLLNCTVDELNINGVQLNEYYIYNIYFCGVVDDASEYVDDFYIDDVIYKIGLDAYDINESLFINASNMGINIPESIQKAIYSNNIHDESIDNILINRKLKELLSNYWDVIANKGSYKSLLNSLKWFEWGDKVEMRELWQYDDRYDSRPVAMIMDEKYKNTLSRFKKTTYYTLSCLLKIIKDENGETSYDSELNPQLLKISHDWSVRELMLKVCMLGNFYEEFFTPIHIDVKFATVEDLVYTNTVKNINSHNITRNYIYSNIIPIKCIVDDTYYIKDVHAYVGFDTMFKTESSTYTADGSKYNDIVVVGVDGEVKSNGTDDILVYPQLYSGPGAIADFNVELKVNELDFIKRSEIVIGYPSGTWETRVDNTIFHPTKNDNGEYIINIQFHILFTLAGEHIIKLTFETGDACAKINKTINIIDNKYPALKLFKLNYNFEGNKWPSKSYKHIISRINQSNINVGTFYDKYIDIKCLNKLVVFKVSPGSEQNITENTYMKANYTFFVRDPNKIKEAGDLEYDSYVVCISNKLWLDIDQENDNAQVSAVTGLGVSLYKNDTIFMPEYYDLHEIDSCDFLDYIISDNDLLCVKVVDINKNNEEIKFGKSIDDFEWLYENKSTGDVFTNHSIINPIILPENGESLSNGYYDIVFNYRLSGVQHSLRMDGAFLKK